MIPVTSSSVRIECGSSSAHAPRKDPAADRTGHAIQDCSQARAIGSSAWAQALNGSLFCATGDNLLWMRPPLLTDIGSSRIGHANDVRAMAAGSNSLYCTTGDGNLWRRDPVLSDVSWQQVGIAPQVRALAATSQGLFAATGGNRLLMLQLP
jgi:hypothetical protein